MPHREPKPWNEWYRLARDTLGYRHDEAAEYANLRFVEEQNRERLGRHAYQQSTEHSGPAGHVPGRHKPA